MSGFAPSKFQFLTTAGAPNAGGTINVYQTGTTTPVTIYTDGGLTTPASNPLTLDANGEAKFYVSGTTNLRIDSYTAAAGFIETIDPVFPVGASSGTGAVTYKSSNFSLASTQSGINLVATAGITVTLPLTTTLTSSFNFEFNAQGGAITFSPQSSDAINQGTTGANLVVPSGSSGIMWTDANGNWGTSFYSTSLYSVGAGKILGNPTAATAAASTLLLPATTAGQLQRSSSTQVALMPFKGNQVVFPNGYVYTIPSGGLASGSVNGGCNLNGTASSTLSAATLYYCYLWYNSGTPALDFSTTAHAIDTTTGIEIKSGDATRVLVGMVYPQTGPVVVDSTSARLVASWHNRQNKYFANAFSADRTCTSASLVEVNSEIRGLFLTWGDAFNCGFNSSYTMTTNAIFEVAATVDGASTVASSLEFAVGADVSSNINNNCSFGGSYAVAEGEHFLTISASSASGTLTLYHTNTTGLSATVFI